MRVAIITEGYFPELSGVTISLHERLMWLSRWGYEVQVYAPDYTALAEMYPNYRDHQGEIMPGITIQSFASVPYDVPYTRDPKPFSFGIIERQIAAFQPDLIHVECPERLSVGFRARVGVSLAHRLGIPATAMFHTDYLGYIDDYKQAIPWLRLPFIVPLLKKIVASIYSSYDLTMIPCRVVEKKLSQLGVKNTRLGPFHGIDPLKFYPNSSHLPAAYQALPESVNVLYVGRLTADKQIGLMLQAFDRVEAQGVRANFILVGSGTLDDQVRAWAADHPNRLRVSRRPHTEIPAYYQGADLLVVGCPVESGPLSAWEAMACGLPVVGPQEGGVAEIVQHERTGLLFRPGDPNDLADSLIRLIKDPGLRKGLGRNALAATQEHTWEKSASAMAEIWAELSGNS